MASISLRSSMAVATVDPPETSGYGDGSQLGGANAVPPPAGSRAGGQPRDGLLLGAVEGDQPVQVQRLQLAADGRLQGAQPDPPAQRLGLLVDGDQLADH